MRSVLFMSAIFALSTSSSAATQTPTDSADDLLVVHCLLPGQLRQLGTRTTYMSVRRPVMTTALDCRVGGGEYVLEDQVSVKTAMRVWLDAAERGDPEAQTTLGELFEQGMGLAPDYEVARFWYEKAAEQGYARALTNLGHLYEKGLGVDQDGAHALSLYRRASGLSAETNTGFSIEQTPDVAPVDALLREQVNELQSALDLLKKENAALRVSLDRSDQSLKAIQAKALADLEAAQNIENLKAQAKIQKARAEQLDVHLAETSQLRVALDQRNELIESLQKQVVEMQTGREQSDQTAEQLVTEIESLQTQSAELQQLLLASRQALTESTTVEDELRNQIAAQQRSIAETETKAARDLGRVGELMAEVARLRSMVESQQRVSTEQASLLAGPVVTLVDPLLPATRGLVKVSFPRASTQVRRIVGRVTAPAGLLSLTVNDQPTDTNDAGVFIYEMHDASDVKVVAIDQQGKRDDLQLAVASDIESDSVEPDLMDVDLGDFHALLIANSRYRHLPQLDTPDADVEALSRVLSDKYGFNVEILRNADRYQMLSALNKLRERLTSKDNLMIYYAGHGELDRANMRGHWLPVDAEPNSTANWVSNVSVTDILNVINARQIMLVVDSCYSGTLTRSSLTNLKGAMTDAERRTWLELMAEKKSRVVLTSGGLEPVMDAGGGGHSVFARALVDVLKTNAELLTGRSLYEAIAGRVAHAASRFEFEQIPGYAPIARSGHEAGDFVLRPLR
ncbi:MAG: caspase family protein [Pseudomonadota bacterium]